MRGIPCELCRLLYLLALLGDYENFWVLYSRLSQSYYGQNDDEFWGGVGFFLEYLKFLPSCKLHVLIQSYPFLVLNCKKVKRMTKELRLMIIICIVSDIISAFIAVRKRTKCFFAVFSSTANKNENKSSTYFWH